MSRQDYVRVARNRLRTTPALTLDVGALDRPGTNLNIIIAGGCSAMAEELERRSSARFGALLAASAQDTDLDNLLLEQTFGELPRKSASASAIVVSITRTGTASGFLDAGTELLVGGTIFTLDAPGLALAAGQTGPVAANFTCSVLGSAGNIAPTQVTGFRSPGLLFDPTLTVAPSALDSTGYAAGGAERETDDAYRARRALWGAGLDENIKLLAAGALTTPGVAYATAAEDLLPSGPLAGSVTLFIGDINGRANAALIARCRAVLRDFRLLGQTINFVSAAPSLQPVTLKINVLDGFDVTSVQGQVRAAIVAFINALPPGATLAQSDLGAAIKSVPGAVFQAAYPFGVSVPAANIVASSTATVFRTTPDLVTFG